MLPLIKNDIKFENIHEESEVIHTWHLYSMYYQQIVNTFYARFNSTINSKVNLTFETMRNFFWIKSVKIFPVRQEHLKYLTRKLLILLKWLLIFENASVYSFIHFELCGNIILFCTLITLRIVW